MTKQLRIGLRVLKLGTFDVGKPGNIQGDEQVARAWQKYLLQCSGVQSVKLYDADSQIVERLDFLIDFNPFLQPYNASKNVLYLQNAFPESQYPGGVVRIFQQVRERFAGYIFTSTDLMRACADGAVVPFATDPDLFYPQRTAAYELPVVFVGNDIRGPLVNHRYLSPAIPLGLVIFGNDWAPPLDVVCRGKLPMEDLPKLYSSALINLNAHLPDHLKSGTINLRIFDILACGGFVISDVSKAVVDEFGETVVCTEGHEDLWAKIVRYLADPEERARRSAAGRKLVLSNHTYANRARAVVSYLNAIA